VFDLLHPTTFELWILALAALVGLARLIRAVEAGRRPRTERHPAESEANVIRQMARARVVSVRNRRSGEELGKVRWYGAWRQYCFYPASLTIFNITCMARISDEMLGMTLDHREGAA
jgi:hypothetical protein